jgi:hypothetical protein
VFLVVYGSLASFLYGAEVFSQYNVLFDSDPNQELPSLAHGWGRASLIHPLIGTIGGGVSRLLAVPFVVLGFEPTAVILVRENIAIWYSPICGALTVGGMFLVFRVIRLTLLSSLTWSFLYGVSFSSIVFFPVPGHYAVSALILISCMLYAIFCCKGNLASGARSWGLLYVVAAGVTITNVVVVAMLQFWTAYRRDVGVARLLATVIKTLVLSLAIVTAMHLMLEWIRRPAGTMLNPVSFVSAYLNLDYLHVAQEIGDVPRQVGLSLVGSSPNIIRNELARLEDGDIDVQFSFEDWLVSATVYQIAFGFGLLVFLSIGLFREDDRIRASVGVLCILVIGFNFGMHSIFGPETFLYSLHWHWSLVLLIGICWSNVVSRRWRNAIGEASVMISIVTAIMANNVCVYSRMVDAIASQHRHLSFDDRLRLKGIACIGL